MRELGAVLLDKPGDPSRDVDDRQRGHADEYDALGISVRQAVRQFDTKTADLGGPNTDARRPSGPPR